MNAVFNADKGERNMDIMLYTNINKLLNTDCILKQKLMGKMHDVVHIAHMGALTSSLVGAGQIILNGIKPFLHLKECYQK